MAILAPVLMSAGAARAQTASSARDENVERLLKALVAEGVLTPDKAAAVAARLEASAKPDPALASPAPITIAPSPAVPARTIAAGPTADRGDRIKIDGDFRVRWQGEYYDGGSATTIPNYGALTTAATALPVTNYVNVQDRTRVRYRVRLGFSAALSDRMSGVLRLAVGNETEPVSTDETLGDYFNRDDVVADRAFLRYEAAPGVSLFAGRMPNPFYATNMVWDGDVNPEGLAAAFVRPVELPWSVGRARLFAAAGVFMLQENASATPDRNLYAVQVGVENLKVPLDGLVRFGLAYYDYDHIRGVVGQPETRNTVLQKGNTLIDIDPRDGYALPALASSFRLVNLTGAASWPAWGKRLTLGADLALNTAYDPAPRAALLTEQGGDLAWLASVTYGDEAVAARGAWQAGFTWRRIESDAVLAAFNEGDFNLGGTNDQGLTAELLVGLSSRTNLQFQYMDTRAIIGPAYGFKALRMTVNGRF